MVEDKQGQPVEARDETEPTVKETESPGEAIARGRASGTPFVLLGGTALVIWGVVAIVAALLLAIWWLV